MFTGMLNAEPSAGGSISLRRIQQREDPRKFPRGNRALVAQSRRSSLFARTTPSASRGTASVRNSFWGGNLTLAQIPRLDSNLILDHDSDLTPLLRLPAGKLEPSARIIYVVDTSVYLTTDSNLDVTYHRCVSPLRFIGRMLGGSKLMRSRYWHFPFDPFQTLEFRPLGHFNEMVRRASQPDYMGVQVHKN